MQPGVVYHFGPFQLDSAARRLFREGEPVALAERQLEILRQLVSRAGTIVSKDMLIDAAWQNVAVTDNSLEQAISVLRRTLGQTAGEPPYIETLARRGYRFSAAVTQTVGRYSIDALEQLLAPHYAFVEGRAALETLEREAVVRAGQVFAEIVRVQPDYAPAHVGLANAMALRFESTRAERVPDREALARAAYHAEEACRLNPSYGEAWATLGLVCHQSGESARAAAAGKHATTLEPGNWRHHVRLAYVSWGEERLRAALRALQLLPDLALAHWLAATVYVARQAFAEAEQELVAGAAAQDHQRDATRFRAAGLHLALGLLRLATGDEASALQEFERELASEESAQIYSREACANAWCAIGAVRLRRAQTAAAIAAFDRAGEAVPGHAVALAAQIAVTAGSSTSLESRLQQLRDRGGLVDAAVAEATFDTLTGHPDRAAHRVHAALDRAPAGGAAWIVPVDSLLNVGAHPEHWRPVLTLLRNRAA